MSLSLAWILPIVSAVVSARRAVGAAKGDREATAAARARVQDAKVALGERGEPWWEPPSEDGRADRVGATIRSLLRRRDGDATICPSEVARAVGGPVWREAMDVVRSVAAALAVDAHLEIRQRGAVVDPATARGPWRIGRGVRFPSPPG